MSALRSGIIFSIAAKDLRHGWQATICLIVAVAVALLPLLVLYGLKSGVVTNLIDELNSDPRVREVRLSSDQILSQDWFGDLANDARVGFILPRARYLAASARLRGPSSRRALDSRIVPTTAGDPYLEGLAVPTGLGEAVLTERASLETGVETGGIVNVLIGRIVDNEQKGMKLDMTVIGVIPRGRLQTDDIFLASEVEQNVEHWREGFAVPEYGWPGVRENRVSNANEEQYASFRLFADSIRDVPGLRDRLLKDGLDVETRSSEIERTLAIEAGLGWVFVAITGLSAAGFLLTLGLHLAASVVEKARELSLLRLLGLQSIEMSLIPSVQGIIIAFIGSGIAGIMALAAQPMMNRSLAGLAGLLGDVSRLTVGDVAVAVLAASVVGAVAGSFAGSRAAALEPTKGLRRD